MLVTVMVDQACVFVVPCKTVREVGFADTEKSTTCTVNTIAEAR
jgi:hypothetical protein